VQEEVSDLLASRSRESSSESTQVAEGVRAT
jgi:hypothetical protein